MSVFRSDVNADKTGVNLKYNAKKASQAIAENTFVSRDAAGNLAPSTATSTSITGVAVGRVTAADDDYASTSEIGYDQPREGEVFLVDVDDAGTAGFVPGVLRTLINAGQVKAAALNGTTDVGLVVVQKVFASTDQALVTVVTPTL